MKKEAESNLNICGKLQFEPANGIKRLQFLLLEYQIFSDNKEDSALPSSLHWPFSLLSLMLHVAKSHALVLLRLPCFFVKLDTKIVGLFAMQEQCKSLTVASLAVTKKYRRLGIGTCILGYIEAIAKSASKKWLETLVLRKNIPAQHFYGQYGFRITEKARTYYIMKKEVY